MPTAASLSDSFLIGDVFPSVIVDNVGALERERWKAKLLTN